MDGEREKERERRAKKREEKVYERMRITVEGEAESFEELSPLFSPVVLRTWKQTRGRAEFIMKRQG
jgi:hypothetical protein